MTTRALRDESTAAAEGNEIRSWVGGCPQADANCSDAVTSGVKSVSPDDSSVGVRSPSGHADDTLEQSDAPRHARRWSGSARRPRPPEDVQRDAVEETYRAERRWDELVELYLGRVDAAESPREKVQACLRLAEVHWEELGDAAAARDALVQALAIDPTDDEVADRLEDLACARDGGWTTLVDAISAMILVASGNPVKARLAERVVRWARGPMNDSATAERFLAQMRTFDPAHPLVHQRLASVYAGVGAWDAQRESLERALSRAEKDEDRLAAHVALGELFEQRVRNRKLASSHYDQALVLEPRSMPALLGLERICRETEQYARLLGVLDAQVDSAGTDADRVGALVRLGEVLEGHFLRPRDAVPKYELALELLPHDARALAGLERCWQALRDWHRLASILEQRAAHAEQPRAAIAALARLAEVRESKQEDVEAALAAWRAAYEQDTSHVQAIHELARLCEKLGDVTAAAAYRARLADLTDDPREKARIHVSVGEMLMPEDRDPACARIHFERAVEMDPRSPAAWQNLQKLAERAGDSMYATFCVERRAEHTDSPRAKALLLVELARMRASLGDARGAFATFEYAFETDPTNETAARAVLADWTRREKWKDAQRACDLLVAAATRDGDSRALLKLLRLSTRIALALGNVDRALAAGTAAYDMAPEDAAARDDVLHVCHELRDRADARDRVRRLAERVAAESAELPPDALVRLGRVRLATGDAHEGIRALMTALTHQPEDPEALAALGAAFLERRDWGRAANCKHRLARATREAAQRQALYLETADIWEKRARAPHRAAAVLEEAFEHGARSASVLHRLVSMWSALGEWEKLVQALLALGQLEPEPSRRAKHAYASAGIVREKIRDVRRAAELYESVLDLDESRLDAFERIVRIWTDCRDWRELEMSYRRMLARLQGGGDPKLAHALYHQLGLVYRDRLGDVVGALDAFRCAARMRPDDAEDRRILVELLVITGQTEVALGEVRASLDADPARPGTHRELYELFLREGRTDGAWCAANVLVHLGQADEVQRRFAHDFRPLDLGDVPGTLAAPAWESHLVSPGLDARLTAVLRWFVPAVVRARLARVPEKSRRAWLGAEVRENDSPAAARVVRLVRDGADILGLPPPLLLARPKQLLPLAVAPLPAPALFVSLPACEAVAPELLAFLVGRRLAQMRPELVAHALCPTLSELKTLLQTALRVAVTRPASHANEEDAALAGSIRPAELGALRDAVSAVVENGARADVRRWHQQADVSISRAGLLLAGDFDLAWRAMQCEPRSPADLAPGDWRAEMLRFAVSDAYLELRDAIGASIEARC